MKLCSWAPQILKAGNRLTKPLSYIPMPPFDKVKGDSTGVADLDQTLKYRRLAPGPKTQYSQSCWMLISLESNYFLLVLYFSINY